MDTELMWAIVVLSVLAAAVLVVIVSVMAAGRIEHQKAQLKALWRRVSELEAQRRAARAAAASAPPPAAPEASPVVSVPEPAASAEPAQLDPARQSAVSATPPLFRKPPDKFTAYWRITHPESAPPEFPPPPLTAAAVPVVPPPLPVPPYEPAVAPRQDTDDTPTVADWEELLGTRVFVWLATAALALADIYLVRSWYEQHTFTPARRLLGGAILSAFWLALGQWRARRNPLIAVGFSAAGIATFFGCLLTAANGAHALPLPWTLLGVAATAVLGVLLALRQGPGVAVVGLAGGFLTPVLLHDAGRETPALFAALFMLEASMLTVARRRGWTVLAALGIAGGLAWAAVWLAEASLQPFPPLAASQRLTLAVFLVGSVILVLLHTVGEGSEARWQGRAPAARALAWGSAVLGLLLTASLLEMAAFGDLEWAYLGILAAACVALGRLRRDYEPLAWVAVTLVLALLAWGSLLARQLPGAFDTLHWTSRIGIGGTFIVLGSFACLWRSAAPVRWAVLSCASALVCLALAYGVLDTSPRSAQWALLALLLVGFYSLTAIRVARRPDLPTGADTVHMCTWTALILIATAIGMVSQGAWLTAGWSLLAPLAILFARRSGQGAPREFAVGILALVTLRLLAWPLMFDHPTGPAVAWNPLLCGYGIPILAFAVSARLLRQDAGTLAYHFESALQAALLVWAALLVRRGFHPLNWGTDAILLAEAGTLTLVWLVLGGGLLALGLECGRTMLAAGGRIIVTLALGVAVLVQLLLWIPAIGWATQVSDVPFWNILLCAYGVPVVLILGLAGYAHSRRESALAAGAAVVGWSLLWALLLMEARHSYHPADVLAGQLSFAELGTHLTQSLVLAWMLWNWGRATSRMMGLVILGLTSAVLVLGPLLVCNPRWWPWDVGTVHLVNGLLLVYGLPAALLGLLALDARREKHWALSRGCGILALVLVFAFLSLEIRHGFHAQWYLAGRLDGPEVAALEMGLYSIVWVTYGVLLLIAGIITGSLVLRGASLAVMLLSVGKVFIWDAAYLHNELRVAAFLGLAVALFGLAHLYQRYVFARKPEDSRNTTSSNA